MEQLEQSAVRLGTPKGYTAIPSLLFHTEAAAFLESGTVKTGRKTINLIGQRFGRLTVLDFPYRRDDRDTWWKCKCDCGNEIEASTQNLRRSGVRSCGCLAREVSSKVHSTHGQSQSKEWRSWSRMRQRCYLTTRQGYHNYGGRGIEVCHRWRESFENFLADMGPMPEGATLERKNNNGNYEPGNCVWATKLDQANNKRTNHPVQFRGKEYRSVALLARELNLDYYRVMNAVKRGRDIEGMLQ